MTTTARVMTVGALREALEDYADYLPVTIGIDGELDLGHSRARVFAEAAIEDVEEVGSHEGACVLLKGTDPS